MRKFWIVTMKGNSAMSGEMRAVLVKGGKGPAEALYVDRVDAPALGPQQILIRVEAAGVNRPDIAQREGNYPPPPGASEILGLEVAGTVEACGPAATRWKVGDRVAALLAGGGYAEFAAVDERHALPIPANLGAVEAAGLPETIFTVWTNLFERGRLAAGETVLIHGANSGIGVTAILMAQAAGATVIATARGADKVREALAQGAHHAIDSDTDDFVALVNALGGADVVLDILGGDYFNRNIDCMKTDGRVVQIATLAGNQVNVDLLNLMFKRLTVTASTLRGRDADEKARLTDAVRANVWPWIENGTVRIPIDRTFPFEQAADAHRWLEAGSQFGKVVLVP